MPSVTKAKKCRRKPGLPPSLLALLLLFLSTAALFHQVLLEAVHARGELREGQNGTSIKIAFDNSQSWDR
jgi:hypothetical protein